jgi:peptidoglycan/LPS O-acetylase OafA/YrhL
VAGISLLCLVLWVYKGNAVDSGALSSRTEFLLGGVRFALSFSMGALALRTYRKYHRRFLHGWLLPVIITAVLVVLLCAPLFSMRSEAFHLLTIAVIFPVTVFLGACLKAPQRAIAACNFLGEASYPLYLLHPLVLRMTYRPAGQRFLDANATHMRYITLACIPPLILVSYAITRWVDEPLRLRLSRWYSVRYRKASVTLPNASTAPTLTV